MLFFILQIKGFWEDMKDNKDTSLSARFTSDEASDLKRLLEKNKKFGNMSEVIHTCTLQGLRYYKIQKEMEDPLFVNKMEENFHINVVIPKIEETFKHMKVTEMDAMMAKLGNLREDKFNLSIKA